MRRFREQPEVLLVSKAADLRQKAALYRHVAGIPTEGGRREDRVLFVIADKLEREAAGLEESDLRAARADFHPEL
jgi:hypothetical protein